MSSSSTAMPIFVEREQFESVRVLRGIPALLARIFGRRTELAANAALTIARGRARCEISQLATQLAEPYSDVELAWFRAPLRKTEGK
jgi:hypothetical protein